MGRACPDWLGAGFACAHWLLPFRFRGRPGPGWSADPGSALSRPTAAANMAVDSATELLFLDTFKHPSAEVRRRSLSTALLVSARAPLGKNRGAAEILGPAQCHPALPSLPPSLPPGLGFGPRPRWTAWSRWLGVGCSFGSPQASEEIRGSHCTVVPTQAQPMPPRLASPPRPCKEGHLVHDP